MVKITQSFSYLKTAAVREERFESAKPNFEKSFHPWMVSPLLSRQFVSLQLSLRRKREERERERKSPTTPVRKLVVRDNLLVPIIIIELLRAAAAEDDPS